MKTLGAFTVPLPCSPDPVPAGGSCPTRGVTARGAQAGSPAATSDQPCQPGHPSAPGSRKPPLVEALLADPQQRRIPGLDGAAEPAAVVATADAGDIVVDAGAALAKLGHVGRVPVRQDAGRPGLASGPRARRGAISAQALRSADSPLGARHGRRRGFEAVERQAGRARPRRAVLDRLPRQLRAPARVPAGDSRAT